MKIIKQSIDLDKIIAYSDVEIDVLTEFRNDVDNTFGINICDELFGEGVLPEIERYFEFFEAISPVVAKAQKEQNEKIASIQYESDHVFLSRAEYSQLITEGHAMIDGKMHYFSNSVYYCIYQGSPEPPTPTGETIDYEISGDTINFNNGTVDEDGFLNIGDITLDGDFIDLNAVIPIIPDEPDEPEEPEVEPVISGDTMTISGATVDDNGFVNVPNGLDLIIE